METKIEKQIILDLENRIEYNNSVLIHKLNIKSAKKDFPFCVFTDIDDTYIYQYQPTREEKANLTEAQIAELIQVTNEKYKRATQEVTNFLDARNIPIIAVTGRDLPLV